jgi:hypothetical protein
MKIHSRPTPKQPVPPTPEDEEVLRKTVTPVDIDITYFETGYEESPNQNSGWEQADEEL